jgi:Ran GTPase-activating protein (RanGAP) involved in mRNA processing and transport
MENNDKIIDISETRIGNYGAKCVAAVLSLCDSLEEIRLANCNVGDDGAIALFDELRTGGAANVNYLELNGNPITEKSIDGLLKLLQSN